MQSRFHSALGNSQVECILEAGTLRGHFFYSKVMDGHAKVSQFESELNVGFGTYQLLSTQVSQAGRLDDYYFLGVFREDDTTIRLIVNSSAQRIHRLMRSYFKSSISINDDCEYFYKV